MVAYSCLRSTVVSVECLPPLNTLHRQSGTACTWLALPQGCASFSNMFIPAIQICLASLFRRSINHDLADSSSD